MAEIQEDSNKTRDKTRERPSDGKAIDSGLSLVYTKYKLRGRFTSAESDEFLCIKACIHANFKNWQF